MLRNLVFAMTCGLESDIGVFVPGILHYRANIDPTINQVCDIGLSEHVCFNREVNDIAYIGIVGSSLASFPFYLMNVFPADHEIRLGRYGRFRKKL